MGGLIDAIANDLEGKVEVRTRTAAREVTRLLEGDPRGRFAVETESGVLYGDHVVFASPAHVVASLLRPLDAAIAGDLEQIPHVSTATVFLAFRRQDVAHPLDGVGFIVPRTEGRPILAGTWVSSKWAGRAPDGHVLVRAFFGGAFGEELLERDDAGLVALARGELSALMGLQAEPEFTRVFRFDRASPQMNVGHLDRMARVHARLQEHPGLYVAGGGYDGVGIPDCIKQGEAVAAKILAASVD
jgi:oxygen-dependent protoporphyrinogen oxidase